MFPRLASIVLPRDFLRAPGMVCKVWAAVCRLFVTVLSWVYGGPYNARGPYNLLAEPEPQQLPRLWFHIPNMR